MRGGGEGGCLAGAVLGRGDVDAQFDAQRGGGVGERVSKVGVNEVDVVFGRRGSGWGVGRGPAGRGGRTYLRGGWTTGR